MGHYCGFGPSIGLSEKSSYASSFPQFIGTNGTSNNWDYGGCHQQVYATGISPRSGYNDVQRSCGNASVGPNDSDSTYWTVHAYQVPDHVQETCSTSFRTSDGSDDCYWSVRTFPVSSTKPHVTQAQPSLHDGTVGYSLKVPPKAEYHEMQVLKVSNSIPIENTLEAVPPKQQSQLCEKKELSLEQQAFLKQKYDETQDNLNQSEECHERSNEKDIHTLCRKLLADLKHIKEERKTRELEAQRKHEEEEIHKELEHFLYNAFNLFQEEHVCEADIVELDAAYVLSYLKEVVYDGKLSLCHSNFGKWINQISKEQEQILVRGTLPFLQAINIDAAKTLMSRTENRGISQSDLRETSTERDRNDAGNSIVRSKIKTEWFPLQSDTINVHSLLPWDPGDQEILVLIMLALNWQFLTFKEFEGSEEYTKQGVVPNNVNIPSCTLERTTAMVVYMGSHKWIMMSDVSRLPFFVQSAAMKQIPAMILPGILGHVISGLICRSEHATNCLHMRCIFPTQIQTGHLRTMLVVIKFCSTCLFSPCHHDLSLTESQVDLAHLFYPLQPAHITCYTHQLSTLLYNIIPSLTWDPESLAYRPEAIQRSIVLENHSSKLAAQVQRIVESVVEDLTSRCWTVPYHHLSRASRNLKMENLQTVNLAWVMELWIVTFLPP